MRFSLPRLGMTWGRIGHQRGKVKFYLSVFVFFPLYSLFRLNMYFQHMNKIHMLVSWVMFHIVIILDFLKLFSLYGHRIFYLDMEFIHGPIGNTHDVLENCPVNLLMKNHLKMKLVVIINRQKFLLFKSISYPFSMMYPVFFFLLNHVV